MNEQIEIVKTNEKKKPNWVARVFIFLAFILGISLLTSCTKAFMSESDKANTIYSYFYGQDSDSSNRTNDTNKASTKRASVKKQSDSDSSGVYDTLASNYLLPSDEWESYISVEYTYNLTATAVENKENTFVVTGTVTPVNSNSIAVKWIDDNFWNAEINESLKSKFGSTVVGVLRESTEITINSNEITAEKTAEDLAKDYYWDVFQSVKAQALFGGFNDEGESVLWKNFDDFYYKAQSDVNFGDTAEKRYELLPTVSFVNGLKTTLNNVANSNRSGLNTSGVGGMFGQSGKKTYMEAKSWGEAFSKYGFFNGLFVWPFGWLINTFTKAFAGAGAWSGVLAILVFTVIIRSIFIILSIFTNKSQIKMTEIQPQANAIQAKYPNAQENREERLAMSRELSALYKKNKVNRFMPFITLIIQFPIFICVWSALQGAAELYSINFYGLEFTTTISSYITGSVTNATATSRVLAIFIFLWMSISQILSMAIPQFFNKWRIRRFSPAKSAPDAPEGTAGKVGKWMVYIMGIFIVITGFSLPSGMSFYWFFGAIMAMIQTFVTETMYTVRRHRRVGDDGDMLSSIRRSKHHSDTSIRKSKKKKS